VNAQSAILSGLWIAWAIYWAVAARNVKVTQRAEPLASRIAFAIPVTIAVILLAGRVEPPSAETYWIGTALVAAGLGFSVWARLHLGRNWSGNVTIKQDHELIRTGPYRFVRHPIYSGLLLAFVGTAIVRGEWRGAAALAILFVAVWRKLKIEERFMSETFGDAYARYREEVRALIPFVL